MFWRTLIPDKRKIDKIFLKKFMIKNKLTHWVSVPSLTDIIFSNGKKVNLKILKNFFLWRSVAEKSS